MEHYLTFEEARAFLHCGKSTLYKLICYQQIPFYKPHNSRVYFKQSELEEWIERGRVATKAEVELEAKRVAKKVGI